MDRWTRLDYLLVVSIALYELLQASAQENDKYWTTRRNSNPRRVIFPTSNETGHTMPVFDPTVASRTVFNPAVDPVVAYVGADKPLAPPVDTFGNPLCVKNPEDTFCEDVKNYPKSMIRRNINFTKDEFKDLFGTQTINPRNLRPDTSEEEVCKIQTRLFYPKAAVNENDIWAFVVNEGEYIQAVLAEVCVREDEPCTYLDGVLPNGMSSHCRQKYAYKRLLALHPDKKKTYTDSFKFPSCCVCYVKRNYILSRTREGLIVEDKKEKL